MLLLRYFTWALLAHISTIHKQNPFGFVLTLIILPYWMFMAFWNLSACDEKELVREGITAVNQGWREGTVALPPLWVRKRFLALGELT